MAVADSAQSYDAFAKHYREYSEKKSPYISAVDRLIEEQFSTKVKSIFDFGCGDGVRGAALFKNLKAHELYAGDISKEMITRTQNLRVAKEVWDLSSKDWEQKNQRFDLIVSLWNVFGHIPTMQDRVEALNKMSRLLTPTGRICIDVNNRHFEGYGKFKVQWRRLLDWIAPDFSRGDVHFKWNIDGKDFPAFGHLFTLAEINKLVELAGLKICVWRTVNYKSGIVSDKVTAGQHFLILSKL
jgi:SAM-dependent methyltransferase